MKAPAAWLRWTFAILWTAFVGFVILVSGMMVLMSLVEEDFRVHGWIGISLVLASIGSLVWVFIWASSSRFRGQPAE